LHSPCHEILFKAAEFPRYQRLPQLFRILFAALVCLEPLRDVSQDDRENVPLVQGNFADRRFSRKLFTGFPDGVDRLTLSHVPCSRRPPGKAADVLAMAAAKPFRDKDFDGLPENVGCSKAKGDLGSMIEEDNALLTVDADYGIGSQCKNFGISLVGVTERIADIDHSQSPFDSLPTMVAIQQYINPDARRHDVA
jgi:hypothetical protein